MSISRSTFGSRGWLQNGGGKRSIIAATTKKRAPLTSDISYICGTETWTLRKREMNYLECFDMWRWRRIHKKKDMKRRVNGKRSIFNKVFKRKGKMDRRHPKEKLFTALLGKKGTLVEFQVIVKEEGEYRCYRLKWGNKMKKLRTGRRKCNVILHRL